MNNKVLLIILLFTCSIFGQDSEKEKKDIHTIKFLKTDNIYTCVYTDIASKNKLVEKSFSFPVLKTIQKIILDGFDVKKDHQLIVQINNSTIVKFEYRMINGKRMLKIRQNNFEKKIFGSSSFFSEKKIRKKLIQVVDNQSVVKL